MDVKRLLPEGAHVVYLPVHAAFMPFDPFAFQEGAEWSKACDDCGALLESEWVDRILYLTASQTCAVEEDGQLTPIDLSPNDFFGLVPEFFDV